MFVLDVFGAFWGIFGISLGILEYIWSMFANIHLHSLFGMGIMFVFVFILFRCHLGGFVFVCLFVLDHEIILVFVFISFRCHIGGFVFVCLFILDRGIIFVNINVRPNLDVWTNECSSLFNNEDTSNGNKAKI